MTSDHREEHRDEQDAALDEASRAEQEEIAEALRFEAELERRQPRLLVVPVLAAINVLVGILFGAATSGWLHADLRRNSSHGAPISAR
jgi:hypothetical protein